MKRADGFISYNFATAIDELTLGIREVIRGEDLMEAKQSQLSIIDAIGAYPLVYRHVPLLCDLKGNKLSKRNGDKGLQKLRNEGKKPNEIIL